MICLGSCLQFNTVVVTVVRVYDYMHCAGAA